MNKLKLCALTALCCCVFNSCSDDDDEQGFYNDVISNAYYYSNDIIQSDNFNDKFEEFTDNQFISTKEQNVSTFSVDADGASYGIMRRYLTNGFEVDQSSVRIEEFLNYFTFDYAEPQDDNNIAINSEMSICPWNQQHYLLRLGIKGKTLQDSELPKANYVFLIDVSGSMDTKEKLPLLKSGLTNMLAYLNPEDRISIITYSGHVEKLLESTPVSEIDKITSAINKLSASGFTNGGQAIKDAYNEAIANYIVGGNNRIILGTDGDFNVGVTSTEDLLELVESYADKGIFLTVCGFGFGNLNDQMMESISNHGNGTYEYIDCENEMIKVFVNERNKFTSVACDSKCQVTFNSSLIESYRLIGYENRQLSYEDFKNDAKDAAEIGSGQTITALYEIVPQKDFFESNSSSDTVITFDFRYKKTLNEQSIPLKNGLRVCDISEIESENFNFAAGVAAFGMILRKSEYKGNANLSMVKDLISNSLTFDPHNYRKELLNLINKAKE